MTSQIDNVDRIWREHVGDGPLVASAIHDGHAVRDEVAALLALSDRERLREEDPFSGAWTNIASTRIIGLRSRFEVDLNRPRDKAVYRRAADAWGLNVWKEALPEDVANHSLELYDTFYQSLGNIYSRLVQRHGVLVVYDLHTYNHRRQGPDSPEADAQANPQVNVGTGTMKNRNRFARIIDRFMADLSDFDFPGGKLDVRENIKFFGGNHPRWAHERFPDRVCVLAIEVKKFFMDEWTGEADLMLVESIGQALAATVPGVLNELSIHRR